MSAPDLLAPLRSAVIGIPGMVALLSQWKSEPAVFTRRPVPDDAGEIYVQINPARVVASGAALTPGRYEVIHDLAVYGRKGAPGSGNDQTRDVEAAGWLLHGHFERNRFSVQPLGFHVIGVLASGPVPAPVDDDEATVGRIVSLTISLRRG